MISYAQNFEDVILHRALMDVEAGFYVDVGANDPDVDSVTRFFYENGWSGINIEPVGHWHNKLSLRRTRDINLALAAGPEPGTLTFYEVVGTGLSTMDSALARYYQEDGGHEVIVQEVAISPLNAVCAEHRKGPIHFLKIDVEGFEGQVLKGLDLSVIRPWIILIEAVNPITREMDCPWDDSLLHAGYSAVYFDGLNRYYLAEEQTERKRHFSVPPNVFDRFMLSGEATSTFAAHLNERFNALSRETVHLQHTLNVQIDGLNAQIDGLNAQIHGLNAQMDVLHREKQHLQTTLLDREGLLAARTHEFAIRECELGHLREEYAVLSSEMNLILGSKSWALTRPVRWSGFQFRLLRQYGLWSRLKALFKKLFKRKVAEVIDLDPRPEPDSTAKEITDRAHGFRVALSAMIGRDESCGS